MKTKHSFFCEKEPVKHKLIKAFQCGDDADPCIFSGMATMEGETAYCLGHDRQCKFVGVFCAFIGSSCKYFSRRNNKVERSDKANLLSAARQAAQSSQAGPDHQSAITYMQFMNHLERFHPAMWVLESIVALLDKKDAGQKEIDNDIDGKETNMAVVVNDAGERG